MTSSPLSLQARHTGLGVCKGCQLMALSGWIPGGFLQGVKEPRFVHDASGRFERCWSTVNCSHSSKTPCRPDTFSLGVCNGCQLMALLGWIPGGSLQDVEQPRFVHNTSGRFECRWSTVEIRPSPSILLKASPALHSYVQDWNLVFLHSRHQHSGFELVIDHQLHLPKAIFCTSRLCDAKYPIL